MARYFKMTFILSVTVVNHAIKFIEVNVGDAVAIFEKDVSLTISA